MIARDALLAGVLAATDQVVQHAGAGEWQAALKTSADRRTLLEQLATQELQSNQHGFLQALRAAATESELALSVMSQVPASESRHQPTLQREVADNRDPVSGRLCTKA